MRRNSALFFAALGSAAATACALQTSACGDTSHVYESRLFVEGRQCLATASSVDVVDGHDPGTCPAVCLVQKTYDGGRAVYVSTMCAPYPFGFDATGTSSSCVAALAALARNDSCLPNDASTSPAPVDASSQGEN